MCIPSKSLFLMFIGYCGDSNILCNVMHMYILNTPKDYLLILNYYSMIYTDSDYT